MQETWVWSLGWENPLEKGMQPTPVFLPGELHGQRILAGYSSCDHKAKHDWSVLSEHTAQNIYSGYSVVEVMEKISGGDGIPAELFQILKDDDVKVLLYIC